MVVDISIVWDNAPKSGRVETSDGVAKGVNAMIGTGSIEGNQFNFTNEGKVHMFFELTSDAVGSAAAPTTISIVDTEKPFSFAVKDALKNGTLSLPAVGVRVMAQENVWASL